MGAGIWTVSSWTPKAMFSPPFESVWEATWKLRVWMRWPWDKCTIITIYGTAWESCICDKWHICWPFYRVFWNFTCSQLRSTPPVLRPCVPGPLVKTHLLSFCINSSWCLGLDFWPGSVRLKPQLGVYDLSSGTMGTRYTEVLTVFTEPQRQMHYLAQSQNSRGISIS